MRNLLVTNMAGNADKFSSVSIMISSSDSLDSDAKFEEEVAKINPAHARNSARNARAFHGYRGTPDAFDLEKWIAALKKPWEEEMPDYGEQNEPDWFEDRIPGTQERKERFPNTTSPLTDDFLNERQMWSSEPNQWKGIHILGGGGQGFVGLWQHSSGRRVAVKKTIKEGWSLSLLREARVMRLLGSGVPPSDHIVKMKHIPPELDLAGGYNSDPQYYHQGQEKLTQAGEKPIDTLVME